MPTKWQKIDVEIPDTLGPSEREQVASDIIEFIRKRTESGLDKNNRDFPEYSKAYIQSLEFKIAGKSASKIDLRLSGDMMAALQLLDHRDGKITIGFQDGSTENDRADGNITGSYGGSPNKKKARDFLGIADDDLASILGQYGGQT